jgi:hypothetical protein
VIGLARYVLVRDGPSAVPIGQVLFAGGRRVTYCGPYYCDEPFADAELYTSE